MTYGMMAVVACVALSDAASGTPSTELKGRHKPEAAYPKEAKYWDKIGSFNLDEHGKAVTVHLYALDSDSMFAKMGENFRVYPNSFSIHAVYGDGSEPWKHRSVFGRARVGFGKVVDQSPAAVSLHLRSKLAGRLMGGLPGLDPEVMKRIVEPQTVTLTVKDGVPVLE